MHDKLIEFWNYKLFTEQLTTREHENNFLRHLCEIAELEFLSKLPRGFRENELVSYIDKMSIKYSRNYDSRYLKKRWVKIFKSKLYNSINDAAPIIFKRDKNKCQYCNRIDKLEIHHVIPQDEKKYNGVDSYYNLVLACKLCNREIFNTIILPQNWWELHPDSKYAKGMF